MDSSTLPLQQHLTALYAKYRDLRDGAVAAYIPDRARVDPVRFGIRVISTDGYRHAVGDCGHEFTIQSISKPAVYAAALADQGRENVLRNLGVEPSGEAFNSISLDPETGAPFKPMINQDRRVEEPFARSRVQTAPGRPAHRCARGTGPRSVERVKGIEPSS